MYPTRTDLDVPYDSLTFLTRFPYAADIWWMGLYERGFKVAIKRVKFFDKYYYFCSAWRDR